MESELLKMNYLPSVKNKKKRFFNRNSSFDNTLTESLISESPKTNFIICKHELLCLETKKDLIIASMDFISILILIISLLYSENENSFEIDVNLQLVSLSFISGLTIIYTFLKCLHMVYTRRILDMVKYLNYDYIWIDRSFIYTLLIYIMHPNYFLNSLSITTSWSYPDHLFEQKINMYIQFFQFTVIFIDTLKRFIILPCTNGKLSVAMENQSFYESKFKFKLKYIFRKKPFYTLLTYLICFILYFSTLLKLAESAIELADETGLRYWSNAIWVAFVTSLRIGYGDYYPITYLGRIICIALGVFGYIMFSLSVIMIRNMVKLKVKDINIYKIIKKKIYNTKIRQKAAKVILELYRCYYSYKFSDMQRYTAHAYKLELALESFKRCKKKSKFTQIYANAY